MKYTQHGNIGTWHYSLVTPAGIYWSSSLGLITIADGAGNDITIADKNLGATSADTTSINSYGYYYQWGNNYGFPTTGNVTTSSTQVNASTYGPGNYYSSSTFITISYSPGDRSSVQNDNLWGDTTDTLIARKGPCDEGCHVPSTDEWVALCGILTSTFGMASNATTMGTYLKMPMPGYRSYSGSGSVVSQGTAGLYWSSSPYVAYSYTSYFDLSSLNPQNNNYRAFGFPIRPFKNDAVQPDSTWTKLY